VPLRGRWAFLLSASNGAIGGIRGLWQLRIPLEGLGMHVHPDMYTLPHGPQAFDDAGGLKDPERLQRLEAMMGNYLDVLRKVRA
jgi:NAD(P)H-dependent FMN reductase